MASLGDFRGEFGKFGMWASVGYKRHPTDFCRGFCFSNRRDQLCFWLAL